MSARDGAAHGPHQSQEAILREPEPFPRPTAERPEETLYDDWRVRLIRNLSRRSDGRWEPLARAGD